MPELIVALVTLVVTAYGVYLQRHSVVKSNKKQTTDLDEGKPDSS